MGLIGFVLTPLWCAMPATYIPTLTFVKHPTIWMETMHRVRGTFTFAPNFAFALARRRTSEEKLAKLDLSCVKVVGCGAEPNNPDNLRAFAEHFKKAGLDPGAMMPCYGMAEATLAMSFCDIGRGVRTDRIDAEAYHGSGQAIAAPAGGWSSCPAASRSWGTRCRSSPTTAASSPSARWARSASRAAASPPATTGSRRPPARPSPPKAC
jgi:fatty-acyl-CoA synthase